VAALIRSQRGLRWWTLAGTTAIALFRSSSGPGFTAGTAAFQFVEHATWIPGLKDQLYRRHRRNQPAARPAHHADFAAVRPLLVELHQDAGA